MISVAAMIWIIFQTVFEHRSVFTAKLTNEQQPETTLVLQDSVKNFIASTVTRSPEITGVYVYLVNLRMNQSDLVFYSVDDTVNDVEMKKYLQMRGTTRMLFTSDVKYNDEMVSIINGTFSCYNYQDTFLSLVDISRVKSVCFISLPPFYGSFNGFLALTVDKELTQRSLDDVQLDARRLSTEIYTKSVRH
jgi:hypothetical protein